MRQLTTLAAAVVLLGTGCAPQQGQVIDRSYTPAWTESTTECITTTGPNRTGTPRTTRRCTPRTTHHSEQHRLQLKDGDDTGWRTVTAYEYRQCTTGTHYPDCTRLGGQR